MIAAATESAGGIDGNMSQLTCKSIQAGQQLTTTEDTQSQTGSDSSRAVWPYGLPGDGALGRSRRVDPCSQRQIAGRNAFRQGLYFCSRSGASGSGRSPGSNCLRGAEAHPIKDKLWLLLLP